MIEVRKVKGITVLVDKQPDDDLWEIIFVIFGVTLLAKIVFVVDFKVESGDVVEDESHIVTVFLFDKIKGNLG